MSHGGVNALKKYYKIFLVKYVKNKKTTRRSGLFCEILDEIVICKYALPRIYEPAYSDYQSIRIHLTNPNLSSNCVHVCCLNEPYCRRRELLHTAIFNRFRDLCEVLNKI